MFAELIMRGFPCLALHGGHDQVDRDNTIIEFKKGIRNILVATSVMSRGLDVPELNLVINYDCPNHLEDYVHRVGRTGRAGRKGWAYTFITPEEDKYAPDLMKSLESSNAEVPERLKAMTEGFLAKQKAGLALGHGSGFGGKGFKFNEEEANKKKDDIKKHKQAMGLDEPEGDSEGEAEEEEAAPADKQSSAQLQIQEFLKTVGPAGISLGGPAKSATEQALQQILLAKQAALPPTPGMVVPSQSEAVRKAAMLAMALNMQKTLVNQTNTQHFTAELEINDYPQQARWKVTHKDALYQITEMTGAAITTRGTFVRPGTSVPLGERKLYLYIEGPTEGAVKQARIEVQRILDETSATARPERSAPGKYRFNF